LQCKKPLLFFGKANKINSRLCYCVTDIAYHFTEIDGEASNKKTADVKNTMAQNEADVKVLSSPSIGKYLRRELIKETYPHEGERLFAMYKSYYL